MTRPKFYNEIFESSEKPRLHYAKTYSLWSQLPLSKQRLLYQKSKKLFSGDYHQDPLPRILTQDELNHLRLGVNQRARAILAFLFDYCKSGTNWRKVMPGSHLHAAIERNHYKNELKKINPEKIAFPYGPDIIRDRTGAWRVVEDSAGVLGGLGDLVASRKILYRQLPGLQGLFGSNHPDHFFENLARYYKKRALRNGGIPLLYLHAYKDEPDQETRRLAQVFRHFGIESTTTSSHVRRLDIREGVSGGVFLKTNRSSERVGALIVRGRPESLDGRIVRIDFQRLKKSKNGVYLNGLLRSITRVLKLSDQLSLKNVLLHERVWTNFTPGTQFINDKVFGIYVDTMIKLFLKEEPILKSLVARPLAMRTRAGHWKLDNSAIRKLRADRGQYVVKDADSDGGVGVWIGNKQPRNSLEPLLEKIRARPEKYIIQEFEHLSVLEDRIVDLRLHAHVDMERIIVSNPPWRRANWIHSNGKVNLCSNGFTSPVVVVD